MVTFGFILGEVVRRVTGRTIGQYLRTEIAEPMGIDVHIGLPVAQHHRCAEMINKPHIRNVLANGGAPGHPDSLDEHPMAGLSAAMGFLPMTNSARTTSPVASGSSPAPTLMFRRWAWRPSTTAWRRRRSSPASTWRRCRCRRAVSTPMSCWDRGLPITAGALATCLTSVASPGPNVQSFGHGGSGGSYGFVDLEHGIGYAYVMNYFDATKRNADPRSTAMSDEIYRIIGAL